MCVCVCVCDVGQVFAIRFIYTFASFFFSALRTEDREAELPYFVVFFCLNMIVIITIVFIIASAATIIIIIINVGFCNIGTALIAYIYTALQLLFSSLPIFRYTHFSSIVFNWKLLFLCILRLSVCIIPSAASSVAYLLCLG